MTRWIRRIVAAFVAYFSIFPLWVAFSFLRLGVERWFGHPYYLGHNHLERGCFWLLVGLAALLPAAYCALIRRASAWWLGLGFVAALLAAVALPSNVLPTMLIPRCGYADGQSQESCERSGNWRRQSGSTAGQRDGTRGDRGQC